MPLFGDDSEPGSEAFHACPECGEDEIYSQSNGFLKKTKYLCDNCGYGAEKSEVKKSFGDFYQESKEERLDDLDGEVQNRKDKNQNKAIEGSEYDREFIESIIEGAEGPGVTAKRLTIDNDVILQALDDNERPHCLIKGAGHRGIEVETGDEIKRTGMKGAGIIDTFNNKITVPNITIATDKRVLALHPLRSGTDEYTIPYDSIDNIRIDRGFIKRRIQVTTQSRTYYFEAAGGEDDKLKPTVNFIRAKREESLATSGKDTPSGDSPVEKLEKLSQLNEKGVISEEEFNEKKSELLDKI